MIESSAAYKEAITADSRKIFVKAVVDITDPDIEYGEVSTTAETWFSKKEQLIDKKHIEIKGLDSIGNNPVTADKDMINQVIYNLIDNAVKFTPDGGYIEVSSKADAEKVIIKIRNSGKGIPNEEIDKIFERFYKLDKSRSYDVKGAGMGLYLCKTIVELHGGNIIARSNPGEFAEFIFQLPL